MAEPAENLDDSNDKDMPMLKRVFHRKKHKNSRLGCPQCKQRRIKCDETLPSCAKCQSRSLRCGYLDYSSSELEQIIVTHWESEGADASKLHYSFQQPLLIHHQQQHTPHGSTHSLPSHFSYNIGPSHQLVQKHSFDSTHPHSQFIQPQPQYPYYSNTPPFTPNNALNYSLNPHFNHQKSHSVPSESSQAQRLVNTSKARRNIPYTDDDDEHHGVRAVRKSIKFYINDTSTHPIAEAVHHFTNSNHATPDSIDSSKTLTPNSDLQYHDQVTAAPNKGSKRSYNDLEVILVPHSLSEPYFDLKLFPEFFDETVANAFARAFLFQEIHFRIRVSWVKYFVFRAILLQGCGSLLSTFPELSVHFLRHRGTVMKYILKELSNVRDSNAELLLILTSVLNSSSIYLKDQITFKDYFSLASGPGALLRAAYDNPERFPKSFIKLKNHSDGLLFTAKYIWMPQYNHKVLFEFLDVLKEFGLKYIENEDFINDDDILVQQYSSLADFVEYCIELLENERSSNEVLQYPVKKVFELLQRWYSIFPSECFTLGTKTPEIEKALCVFWHALTNILDTILVGGRYIFTFFLDGFYLMHTFSREAMLDGIKDDNLIWYINYSCRIIAFFTRRKAYIIRNTILNEPIPKFFDQNDRLKTRSLDIHERCITSFKDTVIRKWHYPMESNRSKNLSNEEGNYYKSNNINTGDRVGGSSDEIKEEYLDESLTQQFELLDSGFSSSLNQDHQASSESLNDSEGDRVDLLTGINPRTSLLLKDFDPRFSDPIFNERVVFQAASLEFLDKYIEDRRLIIQMGDAD